MRLSHILIAFSGPVMGSAPDSSVIEPLSELNQRQVWVLTSV